MEQQQTNAAASGSGNDASNNNNINNRGNTSAAIEAAAVAVAVATQAQETVSNTAQEIDVVDKFEDIQDVDDDEAGPLEADDLVPDNLSDDDDDRADGVVQSSKSSVTAGYFAYLRENSSASDPVRSVSPGALNSNKNNSSGSSSNSNSNSIQNSSAPFNSSSMPISSFYYGLNNHVESDEQRQPQQQVYFNLLEMQPTNEAEINSHMMSQRDAEKSNSNFETVLNEYKCKLALSNSSIAQMKQFNFKRYLISHLFDASALDDINDNDEYKLNNTNSNVKHKSALAIECIDSPFRVNLDALFSFFKLYLFDKLHVSIHNVDIDLISDCFTNLIGDLLNKKQQVGTQIASVSGCLSELRKHLIAQVKLIFDKFEQNSPKLEQMSIVDGFDKQAAASHLGNVVYAEQDEKLVGDVNIRASVAAYERKNVGDSNKDIYAAPKLGRSTKFANRNALNALRNKHIMKRKQFSSLVSMSGLSSLGDSINNTSSISLLNNSNNNNNNNNNNNQPLCGISLKNNMLLKAINKRKLQISCPICSSKVVNMSNAY
jgi:hypothetical protein